MRRIPALLSSSSVHRRLEKLAAFVFLLFAGGIFLGRPEPMANLPFLGQFAKYAYLGSGFFLLLLLVVRIHDQALRNVFKDTLFWLFFALLTASVGLSAHPGANAKLYVFFFLSTAAGLYLSLRFNLEEQRDLIEQAVLASLLLSLFFCLLLPDYGVTLLGSKEALAHKGEWRGIFPHKNFLGRMASLGLLLFTLRFLCDPVRRLGSILSLVICGLVLFYSRSTSSIVVAGLMLLLLPLVSSLRMGSVPTAMAILLTVPPIAYGTAYLVTNFASVMALLGKTPSLSGRVPLWLDCLAFVQKKPLLGYGFGGFWPRPEDPASLSNPGQLVWRSQGWHAPNAHNGLLELTLTVGLIGLGVYLLGFLKLFIEKAAQAKRSDATEIPRVLSSWDVLLLAFIFLSNLAEASFLQHFVWVLYIMIATRPRPSQGSAA